MKTGPSIYCFGLGSLGMALCAATMLGCSRSSSPSPATVPTNAPRRMLAQPTPLADIPPRQTTSSVNTADVKMTPVAVPEPELNLRVTYINSVDGKKVAGLLDDSAGLNRMVREGQKILGYTVKLIDEKAEVVVLERGTITCRLKLGAGAPATPAIKREESNPPVAMATALQGPIPTKYEPTASEKTQGIDPNDSTTWPEGYRGPGIERAQPGK